MIETDHNKTNLKNNSKPIVTVKFTFNAINDKPLVSVCRLQLNCCPANKLGAWLKRGGPAPRPHSWLRPCFHKLFLLSCQKLIILLLSILQHICPHIAYLPTLKALKHLLQIIFPFTVSAFVSMQVLCIQRVTDEIAYFCRRHAV